MLHVSLVRKNEPLHLKGVEGGPSPSVLGVPSPFKVLCALTLGQGTLCHLPPPHLPASGDLKGSIQWVFLVPPPSEGQNNGSMWKSALCIDALQDTTGTCYVKSSTYCPHGSSVFPLLQRSKPKHEPWKEIKMLNMQGRLFWKTWQHLGTRPFSGKNHSFDKSYVKCICKLNMITNIQIFALCLLSSCIQSLNCLSIL